MITYRCSACGVKRKHVKSSSVCPACYSLVEPDQRWWGKNEDKEKLILVYQERAAKQESLFEV